MNPRTPNPQLTDAQLDAALRAEQDEILPSSGFAGSVMAAITRESPAPAPIPFPWKRAIPGFFAAAGALALIVAAFAAVLHSHIAASGHAPLLAAPAALPGQAFLALALHRIASPEILWPLVSLAIPLACLVFMRRILFGR